MSDTADAGTEHLPAGTAVEVLTGFRGDWVPGFEIASIDEFGYRLRRCSDRVELPALFAPPQVRLAR